MYQTRTVTIRKLCIAILNTMCILIGKEELMNNIRNFRERFGLTQEDLAKVLGCTRGAVCHYETGRRGMDINLCRAFINAFKEYGYELTIDDLFPPKAA